MAGHKYTSGGADYAIERFPEKPDIKPRKVVVLVHGTDGLKDFGPRLRAFARVLEKHGYLVVLPNYFGLSDSAPKSGTPDEEVQRLSDAIDWATTSQSDADKAHVGLVGYSLGAALSLVYAEENPGKIKALVDNYGPTDPKAPRMEGTLAMGWTIVKDCAKLPPTLILHNRNDEIVPMKQHSVPLIEALRKTSVKCDFEDYPGGDPKYGFHPFLDGSTEDQNSKQKTIDWLDANL
jgi:dienelactone hydrolase